MAFTYGKAEEEQVGQMMADLTNVLKPFRERGVSSILAFFALLRCARAILRGMPAGLRADLEEAGKLYIAGDAPDTAILGAGGRPF